MLKSKSMGVAFILCATALALSSEGPRVGYPSLDVFRLQATSIVLPIYPPSSVALHHSGTAVVEALVSTKGRVDEVKILEAPDSAIGASVSSAVAQWTFKPLVTDDNVSHPMKGRLIFYFRTVKRKPVVVDAIAERIANATKSLDKNATSH